MIARLSREDLATWPKAELHCHLDGSLRLSTMLELARAQGKLSLLPADSVDGLDEALRRIEHSDSLAEFLEWFRYTIPLLQTREALARAAYELAEDNARDHVRYLELRYGPVLHCEEGLSLEQVNEAVLDGLREAERDFGIRTGVIICGLRDRFESASLAQAELAVRYSDRGVVGFDLAGGEAGHPAKKHLHAFYHARNNLLGLTIHAGEAWGPDSIRQALLYGGAHRIGHGITVMQDPDLVRFIAARQIPLEVCPTSNVQTKVVPSFEEHPIVDLIAAGIPVTVNTDNRLFSRTSCTEELWRAHTRCGVAADQLREVALNGFRHAFLPWDEKQQMLREAIEAMPLPPSDATPMW